MPVETQSEYKTFSFFLIEFHQPLYCHSMVSKSHEQVEDSCWWITTINNMRSVDLFDALTKACCWNTSDFLTLHFNGLKELFCAIFVSAFILFHLLQPHFQSRKLSDRHVLDFRHQSCSEDPDRSETRFYWCFLHVSVAVSKTERSNVILRLVLKGWEHLGVYTVQEENCLCHIFMIRFLIY